MESIIQYFISEKEATPVVAKLCAQKLCKYIDIKSEFILWMQNRSYDVPDPICIEGYTSKHVHELAPFLDGAGVYIFLVTLRDEPMEGLKIIAEGFPRKL